MRPALFVLSLVFLTQGFARLENSICGTHRDRRQERLHLHPRYVTATRKSSRSVFAALPVTSARSRSSRTPTASSRAERILISIGKYHPVLRPPDPSVAYRFQTSDGRIRLSRRDRRRADFASSATTILPALPLPFAFPFFGIPIRRSHKLGRQSDIPRGDAALDRPVSGTTYRRPRADRRTVHGSQSSPQG